MISRLFYVCLLFLLSSLDLFSLNYYPNNGKRGHKDDFIAVLPFVWNDRLDEWCKSIMDNLDRFMNNEVEEYGGISTFQYFNNRFGVSCSVGDHRAFFHWGYQRKPWNEALLRHLPDSIKTDSLKMSAFKSALAYEQRRRNRLTNAITEKVLGFGSQGRSARYANAFISIIYDVHILGDYETKSIEGLAKVQDLVREISTSITTIDAILAKPLVKDLNALVKSKEDESYKAKRVLDYLCCHLPTFIIRADDGKVNMKEHFLSIGFEFRSDLIDTNEANGIVGLMPTIPNNNLIVGVTSTGKYHKRSCGNLLKAKNPVFMPIDEAKANNKIPAKCCFK